MIDSEYHEHHLRLAAAPPVVVRPSPSPGGRAMTDLDEMARELLAQANERLGLKSASGRMRDGEMDAHEREFCNAIRAALLTAPPGWKLVPVEPTADMLKATSWPQCAATDYAHMLAAAPQPK